MCAAGVGGEAGGGRRGVAWLGRPAAAVVVAVHNTAVVPIIFDYVS